MKVSQSILTKKKKITITTISDSELTEAFNHLTQDDLNRIVTEKEIDYK